MVDLTIAICTFNGESRLPQVLDHLAQQQKTAAIAWEVIVIDNASRDGTAAVVRQYQATGALPCPLKYVFEPRQGLAFARMRAIQEAGGTLVAFVDDDNLLTPHWLQAAYDFAQTHPRAGAFGGQIHGKFEVPPPETSSILPCSWRL